MSCCVCYLGRLRNISIVARSLILQSHEQGWAGISLQTSELSPPQSMELQLRLISAAVNPADINMIEGRYLIQPPLGFCLGNEGVFEVITVGEDVHGFKVGDRVILPFKDEQSWVGGWCSHCVVSAESAVKVPEGISDHLAGMSTVNPLTALLLLTRFVTLDPTLPMIQNAANSNLGRWVAAFVKRLGVTCIHIVRSQRALESLSEADQRTALVYEKGIETQVLDRYGYCQLALNGVGGDQAKSLAKVLAPHASLVTYGAMAKQPLSFGNGLFIFQNIVLTGFNRSRFLQEHPVAEIRELYECVFEWMLDVDPSFFPVSKTFSLDSYNQALDHVLSNERLAKVLFVGDGVK
ncbi:MAG: 2-enoyl thioester reductase domain-containing protein [bacterium]